MAADQPFPRGTFKVELGPGEHEVSVIFKPTQSTVVFFIIRPGELAPEYQVHHTRPGRFGRFDETEVVEAARELALAFAEKARPTKLRIRHGQASSICRNHERGGIRQITRCPFVNFFQQRVQ
jgi:hypothetical protein